MFTRGSQTETRYQSVSFADGAVNDGKAKLDKKLQDNNYRTIGEFLYKNDVKRVRAKVDGNKNIYDFYPQRSMLKEEYDLLLQEQNKYHAELLSENVVKELHKTIFYQRDLCPVERGKCTVLGKDYVRAYSALPSSQYFRLLKEINNLSVVYGAYGRTRTGIISD